MTELSFIGGKAARPDAPNKVAGRSLYIHDIVRPGMLYGKIKYSDYPHARIKNIDTSKARKLPGVKAVITGYDIPMFRIGFLRDNPVLKRDKVRQYRDEIAAVAAIDPDIACEALDLIEVEYEELPGVFSPEDALREDAPLVHEVDTSGKPKSDNLVPVPWKLVSGNVEKAKQEAVHICEGYFETPLVQHACLGTSGCIAEFDLQNNLLMHTKTQIPYLAQRDFNHALIAMGLKDRHSRVIVPTLGGGFGSGLDTHAYEFIAIFLAYKTARPVKIVFERREESMALSPRQPTKTYIAQGCDRQGKLLFRELKMTLDNGAYTSWGATTPSVMMLPVSSLYQVPNIFYEAKIVYTNNTYCQAMRGYGNPQATWALESNLDELAEKAGMDPMEIRMLNANQEGQTTSMGLKITTCGLKECLSAISARMQWRDKRSLGKDRARGVGVASLFHTGGGARVYRSDATGVIMKLDDFGNVSVMIGGVEMGQGLESAVALATAQALGVTADKVTVISGDTATCPWDVGTHASRGAFTACNAVIIAARKARQQIFEQAADLFMSRVYYTLTKRQKKDPGFVLPDLDYERICHPSEFELKNNLLYLKECPDSPYLCVKLAEVLRAMHFREHGSMVITEGFYDPDNHMLDPETFKGNISTTYAFGAQGVEVEVDLDTGKVKILKIVGAHDVGKVLNEHTLKGQIYGGMVQGLGYALSEELKTDKGKILNPDFLDYKIFSAPDIDFPIEVEFVETDDPEGPFGAKGVGEPGLVAIAPAIANAIYDAIGVRITSLPITPEKILAALHKTK